MSLRAVTRRPPAADVALAAVLTAGGLVEAVAQADGRPLGVRLALTAAVMGALAWRRLFPLAVLALVTAGVVAIDPNGQLSTFAALVIASFTTGAETDPPRAWAGLALAVVPLWAALLVTDGAISDFVAIGVLYGGSWAVGSAVRERGRQADRLAERAEWLERERAHDAQRAVAEERVRIARELHDIVAHSITGVVLQTQAVRRRLAPEQAKEADDLRAVEATARQAMAEMRRLFGVLRADGQRPSLAPQPGLDQLERLVADARAAGLSVTLDVEGERVPLPPGVDLAAYRIVQEALTNARRHAGGARAAVGLRFGERDLELSIEDDGTAATTNGDGYGLIGMRERVALYGGTLEAGPRPGSGFAVRARLPLRAEARS